MNILLVLPLLIPLLSAALSLAAWRKPRLQAWLCVAATAALLGAALALLWIAWWGEVHTTQVGAWPAPYGITLVVDLFGAIMLVMAGLMGFAVAIYSLSSIDRQRAAFGYFVLYPVMLMGVCGAFLAGDLFNLFVWFEVMLMASFVLLALGGERRQLQGAIVYITLNLVASAIFLSAMGILYGAVGTLNLADLSRKLAAAPHSEFVTAVGMMFLVAFGIKAAIFPLFFWLPPSYPAPPAAVSAIFAALLTKVGVYALIRVFTLLFAHEPRPIYAVLLVVSGFTMITGVLGAAAGNEFRRILSFHIVSQIGYMTLGLGLAGLAESSAVGTLALGGAIFFLVHNILAKTNLFLVSGLVHRVRGSFELKRLGGLSRTHPGLAVLFLISALSLAGIPPSSGFFGKLALARAGLEMRQYALTATALVVGLLTLFSMTKIWAEAFWKPPPAEESPSTASPRPPAPLRRGLLFQFVPSAALAALTLLMGLLAEPVFTLTSRAAEQLLNPRVYVEAVLGATP
jgi:multicomponent Na+:H+ antiporter subunit D